MKPQLFRLFRIQALQLQADLLEDFPGSETILERIIESNPERILKTRAYYIKHISRIDKHSTYFKLVRTKHVTIRDEDLEEKNVEDHPYIHVVLDTHIGFAALEVNTTFASTSENSAILLEKLFGSSPIAMRHNVQINVDAIRDPEDFLTFINRASQITSFYFEVKKPNAFDASDFTRPLKRLNAHANSSKSRTTLHGVNVEKEVAEELTRSSASTGDAAGAKLKLPGMRKFVHKSLGKNWIEIEWREEIIKTAKGLISLAREKYENVRATHND